MNDLKLQALVTAWLEGSEFGEGSPEYEKNWWAIEEVMLLYDEPEILWQFILATFPRTMSSRTAAYLAAGPIEDLLSHHGADYIDEIEKLAKLNEQFKLLLGAVWKGEMKDEIWARIEHIQEQLGGDD